MVLVALIMCFLMLPMDPFIFSGVKSMLIRVGVDRGLAGGQRR